jgi:hypothetical protein
MTPILEPITAGLIVSLFNRFVLPRIVTCFEPRIDTNDHESTSSESSAINADTEVHVHTH